MLKMMAERGDLHPIQGMLLPSELVSQYKCMILPKIDDDRTHKNDTNILS